MEKKRVADILEEIALLLEVSGESPFKARAYESAARTIRELDSDLMQLVQDGRLKEIEGIGDALSRKITLLVTTGALPYYDELRASVPPVLSEMARIPGLGSKRARLLVDRLGLVSLQDLERCCREGKIRDLPGFKAKTEERILKGIQQVKKYGEQILLARALRLGETLASALASLPDVRRVSAAGSARRAKETVEGVVLVASTGDPDRVAGAFSSLPQIREAVREGDDLVRALCEGRLPAALHLVREDDAYATALLSLTGSGAHISGLAGHARRSGLELRDDGLYGGAERLALRDEEGIYRALGLPFIPPELREGTGEIEAAAAGILPELVRLEDVRGIVHVHSTWSDGRLPIDELVTRCEALGYEYVGITDHSQSARYARGLSPESLAAQQEEIDGARERHPRIRVLKGSEVDILPDGSLDYPEEILRTLDFVVASVHSSFNLPKDEQTRRIVGALRHPRTTILGHPTGRLLLRREPYEVDLEEILKAAAQAGVYVELNAHPHRLDLDSAACRLGRSLGARFAIDPDAHDEAGLTDVRFGVAVARRAGLTAKDVLNTVPVDRLDATLACRPA